MYAILKNHRGQPVCLFEIERETPKRIYGRVADMLEKDSWFWVTGLTKGPEQSFAIKEIILCLIGGDTAWHEMKETFQRIKAVHNEVYNEIGSILNDARETARAAEIENDLDARKAFAREIEEHVCNADLL